MIDRLIRKLGKPRCFLVMLAICSLCAIFAVLAIVLHFAGIASLENIDRRAVWVIAPVFLAMWLTFMVCMGSYYIGQVSGKYADLDDRGWKNLPW